MWPFSKKITFSSQYWDLDIVKESFEKSPKNFPSFVKVMPSCKFDPFVKLFRPALKNLKTCSGFINLFKRSILFKMPFDLQVIFTDEGLLEVSAGSASNPNQEAFVHLHHNSQFIDYVKSNYKFIIKVQPMIQIDSSVSIVMQPSFFHLNHFDIVPGILNKKYKGDLNFFIPIKKDQKELLIKKNTPLFLITPLTERKVNLSFNQLNIKYKNKPYFTNIKETVMESI